MAIPIVATDSSPGVSGRQVGTPQATQTFLGIRLNCLCLVPSLVDQGEAAWRVLNAASDKAVSVVCLYYLVFSFTPFLLNNGQVVTRASLALPVAGM